MTGQRPTTLWDSSNVLSSKSELNDSAAQNVGHSSHVWAQILAVEADSEGWSLQTYELSRIEDSNFRDKTRFSTWERKQWLCRVGGAKWPIICKLSSSLCWLLKEKMVTKEIWKLKRLVLKQQKITWEEQYLLKRISAHRERLGRVPHSPCVLEIVSNLAKSRGHPGVQIYVGPVYTDGCLYLVWL